MGERKDWEFISKEAFNNETKDFKRVLCNYIRWDFHIRESGGRFFILSLASSQERLIAQIIMNEEIATELRNAIDKLLTGQIEEEKKEKEERVNEHLTCLLIKNQVKTLAISPYILYISERTAENPVLILC